jgi:GntR family transcriptional regulator of vanillate catabolism
VGGLKVSKVEQLNEVSLAEQAREAIQRAILDGSIAPGERISIERIAAELGVSRTPVREALKALEGDGLVDLEPNRGAMVRQVARDDLFHRYAIRGMIEGYAAELACEADAAGVAKELAANCKRARKIIDGKRATEPKYVRDLVDLNQAFHGVIRERSDSPTISSLLGRLRNPASFSVFFWSSPARQRDSLEHHEAILAAFEAGDAVAARRRVEQHLLDARDFLMEAPEGLAGLKPATR